MRHGDVQRVRVVVADVLPVDRAWPQGDSADRLELLEFVRGHLVEVGRQHLAHPRAAGLEPHEHEAENGLHLHRHQ